MIDDELEREHDAVYRLLATPLTQEQIDAFSPAFQQALRSLQWLWEQNEVRLQRQRKERADGSGEGGK